MLLAVLAQWFKARNPRQAALRAWRADHAAIPFDELKRAGILRTLAGSATLPFSR
ncbi:hypothetical protein [Phreatobacter sp. AB_2022a]|uniref:hypothetical protein n=1 Tax=Phreatobacter sp. AB_2022a TaxID=3003134 RepID=UPI0022876137|nr:hypothetical protein [Phreatobacter sp. AB_2022a]MCZ0738191.1 hypothetical protein [Phreatobacter sp. AB_2022a]